MRPTYRIETVRLDRAGNVVAPEGICPVYETGSTWPTLTIMQSAIVSTRMGMTHKFAPALRTEDQARTLRVALQTPGGLCGLGLSNFDIDKTGCLRTATGLCASWEQGAPEPSAQRSGGGKLRPTLNG